MKPAEHFYKDIEKEAAQKEQYVRIDNFMTGYVIQHEEAKKQYANLKLARERAAYYKWKSLENLDKYLIEFEAAILRKGGKVFWAADEKEACQEIENILTRLQPQYILKSKSSLTEELGITDFVRAKGFRIMESDTGEYIVDEAGEKPWHVVTPAMHKSKAEIAELLNTKIGVSIDADAEHIVRDIRAHYREPFFKTDVAITGANFLIADQGLISITENEGNVRMAMAFAKTHIVFAGIDKIIPTINELDTFLPLLSTYATGQTLSTYNTVTGPKQPGDVDGPSEFIIILVDNGRSNLLAQPDQRQTLSCIKCGACSNVCPVFKTIGGHAYGVAQNGPVGTITAPFMQGMDEYKHLSYASPLCGKCTESCPVNIDLHNHIGRTRRDSVSGGHSKKTEGIMWYTWKKIVLNRKNMNKSTSIKNFMLKSFFKTEWGERRQFPVIAEKSFNQLWREKNNL
jgi:L-lactate dehydrogenase complex protein LldF